MKKRSILAVLMLLVLLMSVLAGCGSEKPAETTAAPAVTVPAADPSQPLSLTDWSMDATAWSSPNGATVNLTATPSGYAEGQSAVFCVRLEGEEVASVPCEWDGTTYTASAELNAADGYCYFVLLTSAEGVESEITVNAPAAPVDESLIDLAEALNAYATVTVTASELSEQTLTITEGTAQIQLPNLTLREGKVTCQQAVLTLSYDSQNVANATLTAEEADETGLCTVDLAGTAFTVPADMEDDRRLELRLDVTLSNGQSISVSAGSWHYLDGNLVQAVG